MTSAERRLFEFRVARVLAGMTPEARARWEGGSERPFAGRRAVGRRRSLARRRRSQAEHDARAVPLIRSWREAPPGGSWRDVARWLNASGVPAPRGGAWHANTVRRIAHRHGVR